MLKRLFPLILFLFTTEGAAQSLSGVVRDENGNPLPSATVLLPALQRWTSTGSEGTFFFEDLPSGRYVLEVSLVGHTKATREIVIPSESLDPIILSSSPVELPAITVTAESQPAVLRNVTLPTTVIGSGTLQWERGASLGKTIENKPGVSGFSGGPLSVKPVIRGLTGQRVLVLSDGQRVEGQTWDEPQSPELDIMDIDHVEIVRGAASVLYGSDALGGVINTVRKNIPSPESGLPVMRGVVTLNAFTNNPQGAGSLSLTGFTGGLGYRANVSTRFAEDYTNPSGTTANGTHVRAGKAFNSGGEEFHGSLGVGMENDWGTLFLDASHFGQDYEISPEPGRKEYEYNINTGLYDSVAAAPHQEIFHERITAGALVPSSAGRFEFTGMFQRNFRKEEGVKETEEDEKRKEALGIKPEVELVLNSFSFNTKFHHNPIGSLYGTVGAVLSVRSNETEGQKPIIPGYSELNVGGYVYEVYQESDGPRFTGGLRYDSRQLDVDANAVLGNGTESLSFGSLTATAGMSWMFTNNFTAAVNVGRAWRAPVAAELFFNGADEGAVRFKIGSAGLKPEESLDLEGSLRYGSSSIQAEVSVFRNAIDRYIFLAPAGFQVNSLDAYRYEQADAALVGGEAWVQAVVTPWLIIDAAYDRVRGTNEKTNSPLPLVPADRIQAGARLTTNDLWGIRDFSLLVRAKLVSRQDRISMFEVGTPAYTLIDAGLSGEVSFMGQGLTMGLLVENVLDAAYFDHLSRYKKYALNPGRCISLKVSTTFQILQ